MSIKKWLNLVLSALWLIAGVWYMADGAGWTIPLVNIGISLIFFLIFLYYAKQESKARDRAQDEQHERHI